MINECKPYFANLSLKQLTDVDASVEIEHFNIILVVGKFSLDLKVILENLLCMMNVVNVGHFTLKS